MVDQQTAIRRLFADNAAALSAGDISALAAFYTKDAIQLPPNAPALVGWEAIRSSLQKELHGLRVEASVEVLETIIAGGWAFARGTYRTVVTPRGDGRRMETKGNWLDILQQQPDGSWKISRSTWTNEESQSLEQ